MMRFTFLLEPEGAHNNIEGRDCLRPFFEVNYELGCSRFWCKVDVIWTVYAKPLSSGKSSPRRCRAGTHGQSRRSESELLLGHHAHSLRRSDGGGAGAARLEPPQDTKDQIASKPPPSPRRRTTRPHRTPPERRVRFCFAPEERTYSLASSETESDAEHSETKSDAEHLPQQGIGKRRNDERAKVPDRGAGARGWAERAPGPRPSTGFR